MLGSVRPTNSLRRNRCSSRSRLRSSHVLRKAEFMWQNSSAPPPSVSTSKDMLLAFARAHTFPPDWDAKWGISFDATRRELRMCRSWTGTCIYLLLFREHSKGAEIAESWVNRDPEQYQEDDTRHDREVASWLIDVFLLGQNREFPSK